MTINFIVFSPGPNPAYADKAKVYTTIMSPLIGNGLLNNLLFTAAINCAEPYTHGMGTIVFHFSGSICHTHQSAGLIL